MEFYVKSDSYINIHLHLPKPLGTLQRTCRTELDMMAPESLRACFINDPLTPLNPKNFFYELDGVLITWYFIKHLLFIGDFMGNYFESLSIHRDLLT